MDTENIKTSLQSKKVRTLIAVLGIAAAALFLFWAGLEVGYDKAAFDYHFGDNYYGIFGPHDINHGVGYIPNDITGAHGVTGKIVSVSLPTIMVADTDNTEKVVQVDSDTVIRQLRNTLSPSELAVGDSIVVIGEPNQNNAEIEAKFIRIVPEPVPATPAPGTPQATTPTQPQ